jgi:hypothetical protein
MSFIGDVDEKMYREYKIFHYACLESICMKGVLKM